MVSTATSAVNSAIFCNTGVLHKTSYYILTHRRLFADVCDAGEQSVGEQSAGQLNKYAN